MFKSNLQNDIDNGRFSLSAPVRDSVLITFKTNPDAQVPNYETSLYVNEDEEWIGAVIYERRQYETLLAEMNSLRSENLMLRSAVDVVKKIMSPTDMIDTNDVLKALTMLNAINDAHNNAPSGETLLAPGIPSTISEFNANNSEYPRNDDTEMTE